MFNSKHLFTNIQPVPLLCTINLLQWVVPMALLFLLILWDLTFFITGVTSCSVTCSTDYEDLLNCSYVPDSVPTYPVLIKVDCSYEDDWAVSSCEVKPPQSWCVIYPENFTDVIFVETECNATISQQDKVIMTPCESSSFVLGDVVKGPPPFNVQVTDTDGLYNITWDSDNNHCYIYRVRIRVSKDLSKDPVLSRLVDPKYFPLDHKKLQPHTKYTVDVQAQMCPQYFLQGPWTEWSSSAEWKTRGTSEENDGINRYRMFLFISLPIIIVLVLLLLGYSQKTFLQKKIQLITYLPKPNEYFKPLYHNYGGNFKEWVNPVFSEYDYFGVKTHEMMSKKQHNVLYCNNEKESYNEDKEMKQDACFLHILQPHCNSPLDFQDGGSSQGTGHSTGPISIHTVTLSGEEEFEEEVTSQSSISTDISYQGGESFGSYDGDNREHAGYDVEPQMCRVDRQNGTLPQHESQISNDSSVGNINFQPHAQFNEPERVSLDSFASNEQSEDGYPHVDLDTIDSGFGECSSPGVAEHRESDLFHDHKSSNSNYVKQWMICSPIQELHETQ
ncbi:hypothetical protein PAMP_002706 [Pampus punctatissimus]